MNIVFALAISLILAWANWQLSLHGVYRQGYHTSRTVGFGEISKWSWVITLTMSVVTILLDGIAGGFMVEHLFEAVDASTLGFVAGVLLALVAHVIAFVMGTRSEYQERD